MLPCNSSDGSDQSALDVSKGRAVLFFYPKASAYRKVDGYWKAVAAELRKPHGRRQPPTRLPVSDPVISRAEGTGIRMGFTFSSTEAFLRVLRARFAVEEFRGRSGRLPADWRELTAKILPAAPEDPFSGESLRYVPRGAAYLLYSVGPDLRDDGGRAVSAPLSAGSRGDYPAGQLIPSKSRRAGARAPTGP